MFRKTARRLYHNLIKKDNLYELYDLYQRTQYWSKDKIRNYQLNQLQDLYSHSLKNVPYYSNVAKKFDLKKIRSFSDLKKLPIIDKETIRDNKENFIAKNISEDRFKSNSTSGSTGSNFSFYSDRKQYSISQALTMRRYDWMNVDFFDPELVIWGAHWDVDDSDIFSKVKHFMKNVKMISGYHLSDNDILEIHNLMQNYQPKILKSYPSILTQIIDVFKKNDILYHPDAIHIGGENLYDFQKTKIEDYFNTTVFDFYGARDMPNIAQSCPQEEGLHIFSENVIVEVVNESGEPIEEGEGDLVITNLHNYVMPFIRYKIGDRAKISKDNNCSCARNLPLLDEITGRKFELITFPNGNRVMGTFWTILFRSVNGIKDFQVVQEDIDEIIINYTTTGEFEENNLETLKKRIFEYSGDALQIHFIKKDSIERTEAGKRRFVISKVDNYERSNVS